MPQSSPRPFLAVPARPSDWQLEIHFINGNRPRSTYCEHVVGKPASRESFARLAESMFANAPSRQIPRIAC
jgi:hypothetical protein